MDGIIFDLDGTLWDSTEVVLKAWNDVLRRTNGIERFLTIEDIKGIMGLQLPKIGEKLIPYLNEELRMKILEECCSYECKLILKEGGVLYEELKETIRTLSKKYPLFIVSNCLEGYIEAFLEYHELGEYFTDFIFAGTKGLSKGENIKLIMERHKLKNPVYVGDTQGDCDASKYAGIPFIHAGYGFGSVNKESCYKVISSIGELLDI